MNSLRDIDIKYIKGIGPDRAKLLEKELGMRSVYDLIHHYPSSYVDRSTVYSISQFGGEMPAVQIRGRFVVFNLQGEGAKTRLTAIFTDGTGNIEVTWFRSISQIRNAYMPGREYILFGKPTPFNGRWQMVHPEIDNAESTTDNEGLRGVYPLTDKLRQRGISSRMIRRWVQSALTAHSRLVDPMPQSILQRLHLMPIGDALLNIHNPSDPTTLQRARERLKFDELFLIQIDMVHRSRKRRAQLIGHSFSVIGHWFNTFYNECLPFDLTNAQKRVIREIRADVNTGRQMNRLVQGDVGSGKTLVALMAMLMALDNGGQACMMAPTEILAEQHYNTIREMVAKIGINVRLLRGSTSTKERREIHQALADGSLQILIGTHAVLEDDVQFRNLTMAVIDEQHRFGVAQRARLWTKNAIPPHVLVMTATPIPRTLAMTVYGDLDVSVIDQLPPGRKPVTTVLRYNEQREYINQFVFSQIRLGRQVYIVYPLIEENEKLDLMSLQEGYDMVREWFPHCQVAFVHGRMKPAEKEYQMQLFANHQADILVATTVIEVGVNVPNATVMIIENAERFGLSQLHQLRGRVGRGADQSYCVLITKEKIGKETRERLNVMTSTTDGFVIAEADLKMRGPGDIEGTMQSGLPFDLHIANLATDGQIIQIARDEAAILLEADPDITSPNHAELRRTLELTLARSADWSRIS